MPTVVPSEVVRVIDLNFEWAAGTAPSPRLDINHIGRVAAVLALVDRIPPHLLTLNATEYADYINAVKALRSRPQLWLAQPTHTRSAESIRTIRSFLTQCPDDWPAPSVHELTFIADTRLRDDLRRDIDHAQRALDASEWKASTVLAGSVIEAVLLWALEQKDQKIPGTALAQAKSLQLSLRGPRPVDWDLHCYVLVAEGLKIIEKDTTVSAGLAKNFRNLIHPGKSLRQQQRCDRGTAHSALGALFNIIRDVEKWDAAGQP